MRSIAVPTLVLVITLSFFLMRLAPGGPFDLERPLPPAAMENLRRVYGLDQPQLSVWYSTQPPRNRVTRGIKPRSPRPPPPPPP